jgi:hypothetical protein
VQEAEGAPAAGDRTGILRFPVGEQEAPMALRFVHHRRGIFFCAAVSASSSHAFFRVGTTGLCYPVPAPLPRLPP